MLSINQLLHHVSIFPPQFVQESPDTDEKKSEFLSFYISTHSLFCLRQLIVVFQMQIYVLLLGTSWFCSTAGFPVL